MKISEEEWSVRYGQVDTPHLRILATSSPHGKPVSRAKFIATINAIAAVPELLALAESVRASFSPNGEYNSRTAELSLRELRQAAVEVLTKAGCGRKR